MSTTENKGKIIRRTITDPITNLRAHVEFLNKPTPRAAEINGFDVEFNYVEKTSRQTEVTTESKTANLAENNDKNRYMNVKPPDFSRVRLTPIPGVPGSDYVNANFITGHGNKSNTYISAQGPLENTAHDFWRMVWEHKLFVVVMLTKEIENEKIKCSRYWPLESQTLTYGSLQITLEQTTSIKDLITRKVKFENIDTKESRQVVHFQYTGWLDHGIPPSTKSFLNLLQAVDSTNSSAPKQLSGTPPPILIHCSAGIGRSGTFCAIHMNWHLMKDHFEKAEKPPPLNIVNTILNLRKERPGMVQTKEQFIFVYAVILEEYRRMQKEAKKRFKAENGDSQSGASVEEVITTATTTATTTTTAIASATTTTSESASTASLTPSPQSN